GSWPRLVLTREEFPAGIRGPREWRRYGHRMRDGGHGALRRTSRTCARPGCRAPAVASFNFDGLRRIVWLEPLAEAAIRSAGDLCRRHVDLLRPPRNWEVRDLRPVAVAAGPTGALAPSRFHAPVPPPPPPARRARDERRSWPAHRSTSSAARQRGHRAVPTAPPRSSGHGAATTRSVAPADPRAAAPRGRSRPRRRPAAGHRARAPAR